MTSQKYFIIRVEDSDGTFFYPQNGFTDRFSTDLDTATIFTEHDDIEKIVNKIYKDNPQFVTIVVWTSLPRVGEMYSVMMRIV